MGRAVDGRMMCTRYVTADGYLTGERQHFDWDFGRLLQYAAEHQTHWLDIEGLDDFEAVALLSAPEFWQTTVELVSNWDRSYPGDVDYDDTFHVNDLAVAVGNRTLRVLSEPDAIAHRSTRRRQPPAPP